MATERGIARPSRFRSIVLLALGVFFVIFLSASGIAQLLTDMWWFDNVGHLDVWTTILGTRVVLAVVFSLIFFALVWVNLYLVDRFSPTIRAFTPEEDLIERYHNIVEGNAGKLRLAVSAVFALIVGLNTSQQWETWLLFRNGGDFGFVDPLFNKDAGFYVFRLPFWTFLVGWVFAALIFVLLLSLVAHYLGGGIRVAARRDRVTPFVKLHVSVLLALLAVTRAVAYYLDRFQLVNAQRGAYDGALATDVEVQLPALNLLAVISLFGACLFVANIWRKGWGLPVMALGVWLVSHIVVGSMLPGLYQRFRVEVEESTREREFIGDNISATRYAYGLSSDSLRSEVYAYSGELTQQDLVDGEAILDDVTILDRELADASFKRVEGDLQAFDFAEVLDVDRYEIEGELEPVVLGVRELDLDSFDRWEARHIAHTHGYGVAVAEANGIADGLPEFLVSGVGEGQTLDAGFENQLEQPQIYYSEDFDGYAIVGATRDEVDYPRNPEAAFRYDGDGGVKIDSIFRKAMFSLRFQQYQPMISPFVGSDSKVIYNRDINIRIRELAPFLDFDSEPYPVLADGQVFWVIDAYTTTSRFPYSQQVSTDSFTTRADLSGGFNYVRNSVKVVVDAYNGDVDFYVVDESDPMIQAYQKSFPDLFTSAEEAPSAVANHFRYPTDLFKVQTDMWGTYQVNDPVQFLEGALAWQVARAAVQEATVEENVNTGLTVTSNTVGPMEPQYRTTQLPGSDETEFVLQRAFEPRSDTGANARPVLRSILVARSDPEHYGELVQYLLPAGEALAPRIVSSNAVSDAAISQAISLLDGPGSSVLFGEMQLVMIGETVVYIWPLYVKADEAAAPPQLSKIIAYNGSTAVMEPTLDAAVRRLATGEAPEVAQPDDGDESDDTDTDPGTGSTPEATNLDGLSAAELLGLVDAWLTEADKAAAEGDSETADELRARAHVGLARLADVLGVEPKQSTQEAGEA